MVTGQWNNALTDPIASSVVRQPAEVFYADELAVLAANDPDPRPPGWRLSPKAVRRFIVGSDRQALSAEVDGRRIQTPVTRKFYGDDALIDRSIVTLMSNRGLILIGEPGTAKSMLSELLAAAISGASTNTIQGTAGTTEDQIKHSWNYALLLAEGPSLRALVPSPLYRGLKDGLIVRFEEITRCPPEIQDTMVSVLSDKILHVPELGDEATVLAKRGFNVIATANIRDRGVHEMSSALKRRFNFETVHPIADKDLELELVITQTKQLLGEASAQAKVDRDVIDLLVTTFHDLRNGKTVEVIDELEAAGRSRCTTEAIRLLVMACQMGLHDHTDQLLEVIARNVVEDPQFTSLADGLGQLILLWQSREPLEAHNLPEVRRLTRVCYERACYLAGELANCPAEQFEPSLSGIASLREALSISEDLFDADLFTAAMRTLFQSAKAPALLAGAAAGVLYHSGQIDQPTLLDTFVGQVHSARRDAAGRTGFLRGLLFTCRETAWQAPALLQTVDQMFGQWVNDEFHERLPELRLAFAELTPRELDRVAQGVAALHGINDLGELVLPDVEEGELQMGLAVSEVVRRVMRRDALEDWLKDE